MAALDRITALYFRNPLDSGSRATLHRERAKIMASAVTDLEAGLQAMLNLKPPGVSGSRITSLTSLCVANIQVLPFHHLMLVVRHIRFPLMRY